MPPRDVPGLALEDADDVLAGLRRALVVGEHAAEVDRVRRAVDASQQRHRELARAVLAGVEIGAEVPAGRRILVGHEDLGERALVEDRPQPAVIVVADEREHQAGARIAPDVEAPALPGHLVAVELEAGAFRLLDQERLPLAGRPDRLVGCVSCACVCCAIPPSAPASPNEPSNTDGSGSAGRRSTRPIWATGRSTDRRRFRRWRSVNVDW